MLNNKMLPFVIAYRTKSNNINYLTARSWNANITIENPINIHHYTDIILLFYNFQQRNVEVNIIIPPYHIITRSYTIIFHFAYIYFIISFLFDLKNCNYILIYFYAHIFQKICHDYLYYFLKRTVQIL